MEYKGTTTIRAPRDRVWNFLMDPHSVGRCLPGLESLEIQGEDRFFAVVKAGIGFVKGSFKFEFSITDKEPPTRAKLVGRGRGTGSAIDLTTSFDLEEVPDGGTVMNWRAEAKVAGMLAGLGSRLIDTAAQKTIEELFTRIKGELEEKAGSP